MVNIDRVRVAWSGFVGAPGVSTFYSTDGPYTIGALANFFAGIAPLLPVDVTIAFPASGDTIDPLSGDLVSAWSMTPPADVVGTGTGPYAAPCGVMVRWETGSILDGHRLVGRTYLVPIVGSVFDGDGSINSGNLTDLRDTVNAFLTADAGRLVVWHRPRATSIKHPVYRAGGYTAVNAATVPDEAVVLRSRRD